MRIRKIRNFVLHLFYKSVKKIIVKNTGLKKIKIFYSSAELTKSLVMILKVFVWISSGLYKQTILRSMFRPFLLFRSLKGITKFFKICLWQLVILILLPYRMLLQFNYQLKQNWMPGWLFTLFYLGFYQLYASINLVQVLHSFKTPGKSQWLRSRSTPRESNKCTGIIGWRFPSIHL